MRWTRILLVLGLITTGVLAPITGQASAAAPVRRGPQAGPNLVRDEARRVAARIDELMAAAQARDGVRPAPLAEDSAFLRRVTLDVTGRIPQVIEVRRFLSDGSPEKRIDAVERLLDSPGYINHFTNLYLNLLVPEAQADFNRRFLLPGFMSWLRKQFAENQSYDKLVTELVTLPMAQPQSGMRQAFFDGGNQQASPMAFYQVKAGKPDDIAASVARLFLGVRLECAQCHDHPFGKWKREQFWSQAAFFAGLKGQGNDNFFGQISEASDRREINIPNTDRVAQARFLDETDPRWKFKVGARTTYAQWMTARDNPFFARAMVNRMWGHFFGIGLVDPVDDIVDDNPASHPEVLDYLAKEFAEHNFDIKFLIRAIVYTRTYQLSSQVEGKEPSDPRAFARMSVKGLTGEQLYDSLVIATGIRDTMTSQQRLYALGTPRQTFLDRFADQEKKTEYHSSIPQALTMMNNQVIIDATHYERGELLGAVVNAPFMDTRGKIETLFLAALSRKPRSVELDRFTRYVEKNGEAGQKKALSDVFWALLNSSEFKFNH